MRLTQDNIQAEFMRAGALQQAARHAEAAELWREIVAAAPTSPEAALNLGGTLLELGDFVGAEAQMRRAIDLRPDAAWTHYNLGRLCLLAHRWSEAEAAYLDALRLAPDEPKVRLGLAHLYLTLGDYGRGWPLFEARTEIAAQNAPRPNLPGEWRGEPVGGRRMLLLPEQGFGDQIQFARFAPILRRMGAEVTLVAPPELTALFAGLGVQVIEQAPGEMRLPEPDAWSLLMSVPHRLGVTLETLPAAPYLASPADRRARWRGDAAQGAVGVVWRGRATAINAQRSLPGPESLQPLADAGARLVDLTEPAGDFADLAARIDQLDLLVTVDTAAAHLAGAMGKPCWVLLPWLRSDWRWLADRADSPWYPSVRLFRQPAFGQWEPAVAELAQAYRAQFRS